MLGGASNSRQEEGGVGERVIAGNSSGPRVSPGEYNRCGEAVGAVSGGL